VLIADVIVARAFARDANAAVDRSERAADLDVTGMSGAARQVVVVVVAGRAVARIERRVANPDAPRADRCLRIELEAANARLVQIRGDERRRVVDDQLIDTRVERRQRGGPGRLAPSDGDLVGVGLLRIKIRIAETRVVQIVECRCAEGATPTGAGPKTFGDRPLPT